MFSTVFKLNTFALAISGIGHMPIFKRYYIADIPGLWWLAEFQITLAIHYLSAALFLAMVFYAATGFLLSSGDTRFIPAAEKVKWGFYGLAILSGLMLVYKNLNGIWLPPMAITAMDLTHLLGALALGITAWIARRRQKSQVIS